MICNKKKKKCVICCYALNWVKNTHFCRIDKLIYQPNSDFFSTDIWNNFAEFANWKQTELFFIEFTKYLYSDNMQHFFIWLFGLGVWFSLRVREVPGSNPGGAHHFFFCTIAKKDFVWISFQKFIIIIGLRNSFCLHTFCLYY